ncbi:MAG: sodium:solute symporter family protein [Armatimonadota bacterium]|nr:MAG: sodium:solute symporter family protein [Armatimonadota bacterium]
MLGLDTVDWTVVVVYLLGITALGVWSKRAVHDREDFLLGGRRFGKAMMVMHAFGTGTHTDQAAAVVSRSYAHGVSGIWAQWNWMMVTPFYWLLAPLLRRSRVLTIADWYEERYGPSVGILAVIVSSIGSIFAIGTMLLGTSRTVQGLLAIDPALDVLRLPFGLVVPDASFNVSLFVMTALFLLYGAFGGIVGAVRTDFVQGFMIIILSGLALPFAFHGIGGMSGVARGVPDGFLNLTGERFSLVFIGALTITSLFSIVSQSHIISVTSAGRTEWEGRVGMTYGNFLKRLCTIAWCLLGVVWLVRAPGLANPDAAFGDAVSKLLPLGLRGLMLASIMAAAMSTCDSMMVAVSGLCTETVYRRHIRRDAPEAHYLNVARVISAIVVIGAIIFAYSVTDIFQGLTSFWKVTATMGIAFWLGVLWRRSTTAGAWASFLAAAAAWFVALRVLGWSEGQQMALYIPVGILAGIVVSLVTPAPNRASLDRFFTKIHTPIGHDDKLGLSFDEAVPPHARLIDAAGILVCKPSRQSWLGFVVAWLIVGILVGGMWLIVRV